MAHQNHPHGTAGGPGLDSDLDDLLGNGADSPSKSVAQSAFASTSSTYTYADLHKSYYSSHGGLGCCGYISACCWLTFQSSPKCGWILTLLALTGMAYGLMYLLDPTVQVGVVDHDWTSVQSIYDLKAGDINHWCLAGDDSSCRCEDPLVPADRGEYKSWSKAHAANKRLINRYTDPYSPDSGDVDVAFLGESLIEEMDGRWLGMTQGEHLESLAKMFNKRFQKRYGAPLEAVPLGIAGDASPNVLYRLLHGEMPDAFNPRVWWISMGMNDLARMQCSEEVVIMGILRVVEEIRMKKPDAKIVINSLLPMTDVRSGAFPLANDYKDAFRTNVNIPARGIGRGRIFGPRPTVTVDSSHIARKPSKAIQGEKDDDDDGADKGRGNNKFPKALRTRRLAGKRSTAKMTPEQKRQAELDDKRARMQELLKKRQAFMNKQLAKRLRNDKVNPVLRDQTTYKRRDPKKLFVRQTETPLWPAINVINNNLRRFAEKHEKIVFFDSTEIFAERSGRARGAWILKSNMISVRGHPTEDGFRAWEDAVAAKLKYMLKDKPKVGTTVEQPANVLPAGNPVVPEPKPIPQVPQTPQTPPTFPTKEQPDDEISESELSGDDSRDDAKKESSDDTKKEDAEEDSEEEEESESGDEAEVEEDSGSEDDQADESDSQVADNSAQSGEEESEDEEPNDDASEDESVDDAASDEDESESEEEEEQEEADSSEEEEEEEEVAVKKPTKTVVSSSAAKAAAKGSSVTKTTSEGTTKTTFTKTTAATKSTAGKKPSGTSSTVTKKAPSGGKTEPAEKTTSPATSTAEKKAPTKATSTKTTSTKKATKTVAKPDSED